MNSNAKVCFTKYFPTLKFLVRSLESLETDGLRNFHERIPTLIRTRATEKKFKSQSRGTFIFTISRSSSKDLPREGNIIEFIYIDLFQIKISLK